MVPAKRRTLTVDRFSSQVWLSEHNILSETVVGLFFLVIFCSSFKRGLTVVPLVFLFFGIVMVKSKLVYVTFMIFFLSFFIVCQCCICFFVYIICQKKTQHPGILASSFLCCGDSECRMMCCCWDVCGSAMLQFVLRLCLLYELNEEWRRAFIYLVSFLLI